MKAKIVTREHGAWRMGVAALMLAVGCAEAPRRVDDDPGSEEVSAESEEARAGDTGDGDSIPPGEWQEVAFDAGASREKEDEQPRSQEEEEEAPHSEAKHEEERGRVADAGPDAARDAAEELTSDAANVADAANAADAADASSEDASLPLDPCAAKPCQHDGICAGEADRYTCACPEGFTGQHCERKVCGDTTIRARTDVEAHRECAEIRGDLSIASVGLTEITADDFPLLTKITGGLIIAGAQATDRPRLESVTLANLREVAGAVMVVGVAVVEFGGSGPLRELRLPTLERVGALGAYQANLQVLDLPALRTIEGPAMLHTLFDLCTVNLDGVERVGGELTVHYVPRLSPTRLEALRAAAGGPVSEQLLGCCAASSDEQGSCDGFTERARELYCTGC